MEESKTSSLLDRFKRVWTDLSSTVTETARVKLTGAVRPDLPDDDLERLRKQIDVCLEGKGGEVSARARAADLGHTYLNLSQEGRHRFLRLLAEAYGTDHLALKAATDKWIASMAAEDSDTRAEEIMRCEQEMRAALTAPRVTLLTQFNALPQGVKFLVDMRKDLLPLARKDSNLKALDDDFKALLKSWFDVGFLDLRVITWDAPASLLEKLTLYEAVHAVQSWSDLKNRLGEDRRCYAFFHPRMPDEPLIFVWVALVPEMSGNVQALLDVDAPTGDPEKATTAIFYSISNAQAGLAGVSFGNFLIKRVVDDLRRDFPNVKNFATLSPIPGFMRWFNEAYESQGGDLLTPAEVAQLAEVSGGDDAIDFLHKQLQGKAWAEDESLRKVLKGPLKRLAAHYLLNEKRRGRAQDPVAHFHLSNGARMERLNWLGDTSDKGFKQSGGLMINYYYQLDQIDGNHEAYTGEGQIRVSNNISGLL